MSAEENKKIILEWCDNFSKGEVDAVQAAFADDATWWLPGSLPVSGTYVGKKEIFEEFFGQALALFQPDTISIEVKGAIAEGDAVAVEWMAHGTSAKGKAYDNHYHVLFELHDGKIKAVREYVDTLYANDVLFS